MAPARAGRGRGAGLGGRLPTATELLAAGDRELAEESADAARRAPPAALRRAQREVVARGAPPRLWAAFAFHGDWR